MEIQPGAGWWKADDGGWYPPRWEYAHMVYQQTAGHRQAMLDDLAERGRQGWEAVSASNGGGPTVILTVLFKRPLRS